MREAVIVAATRTPVGRRNGVLAEVRADDLAARMFDRLRKEHIPVKMVSTSEIKVSVVVPQDDMVKAANALHDEFNLAEKAIV